MQSAYERVILLRITNRQLLGSYTDHKEADHDLTSLFGLMVLAAKLSLNVVESSFLS